LGKIVNAAQNRRAITPSHQFAANAATNLAAPTFLIHSALLHGEKHTERNFNN